MFKAFGPKEENASPLLAHEPACAPDRFSSLPGGQGAQAIHTGALVLVHLLIPWFLSVQAEVLDKEDNVEEDGEDAESKLGWVSKDQCPLVC